MYYNRIKMCISICIWAVLSVIGVFMAIVFLGTMSSGKVTDAPTLIIFFLFGTGGGFLAVIFWKKFFDFMQYYRYSTLFAADADGFVPLADLAHATGTPEVKLQKKIQNAIRKGYMVNVNYSAKDRAFLLSDKVTKPEPNLQGLPELKPFLGISCPGCAAALKIRAATSGTCPYCGRLITAPEYKADNIINR